MAEQLTPEVTRIKKGRKQKAFSFFTYFFVITKKDIVPLAYFVLSPVTSLLVIILVKNTVFKKFLSWVEEEKIAKNFNQLKTCVGTCFSFVIIVQRLSEKPVKHVRWNFLRK